MPPLPPQSVVKGEGLVKFAPDCFIDVLSYVRGEIDPAKVYAIFNGTLPHDEVLRVSVPVFPLYWLDIFVSFCFFLFVL